MKKGYFFALLCCYATSAMGQNIVQWTFDSALPDGDVTTGSTTPLLNLTPAATYSAVGTISNAFVTGYPNNPPGGDNSALTSSAYPAQGAATEAGVRFDVNTSGRTGIIVSMFSYQSNTSSKYVRFQYTIDGGITWTTPDLTAVNTLGSSPGSIDETNDLFVTPTPATWNYRVVDLTGVIGTGNNPLFGIRMIVAFDPATGNSYAATNTTGNYSSNGTIRYDNVTFGENSSLPIRIAEFMGHASANRKITLQWRATDAGDATTYFIERSSEQNEVKTIGAIQADATTTPGAFYQYEDLQPVQGANYYRIRAVESGARTVYSQWLRVDLLAAAEAEISIIGNPTTDNFGVQFPRGAVRSLTVANLDGRVLYREPVAADSERSFLTLREWPTGTYLLRIDLANGVAEYRKITKQ